MKINFQIYTEKHVTITAFYATVLTRFKSRSDNKKSFLNSFMTVVCFSPFNPKQMNLLHLQTMLLKWN